MKNLIVSIILLIGFQGFCLSQEQTNCTIMHYAAGSNSSETDLMSDIHEQSKNSSEYNLVTLIDRIEGFSDDS